MRHSGLQLTANVLREETVKQQLSVNDKRLKMIMIKDMMRLILTGKYAYLCAIQHLKQLLELEITILDQDISRAARVLTNIYELHVISEKFI